MKIMTLKAKERIERHMNECEKAVGRLYKNKEHYSVYIATLHLGYYLENISTDLFNDTITFDEYQEYRKYFDRKSSEVLDFVLTLDRKE